MPFFPCAEEAAKTRVIFYDLEYSCISDSTYVHTYPTSSAATVTTCTSSTAITVLPKRDAFGMGIEGLIAAVSVNKEKDGTVSLRGRDCGVGVTVVEKDKGACRGTPR